MLTRPSELLTRGSGGYSARVKLELWIDGKCTRLAQVGHDRVKPHDKTLKPRIGRGELVVTIDDERQVRPIEILEGEMAGGFFPIRDVA